MPFGLRNGLAVFQRLMDQILHRDKDMSQVYIDDITIFSASWEEHCQHIAQVLDRLKQALWLMLRSASGDKHPVNF